MPHERKLILPFVSSPSHLLFSLALSFNVSVLLCNFLTFYLSLSNKRINTEALSSTHTHAHTQAIRDVNHHKRLVGALPSGWALWFSGVFDLFCSHLCTGRGPTVWAGNLSKLGDGACVLLMTSHTLHCTSTYCSLCCTHLSSLPLRVLRSHLCLLPNTHPQHLERHSVCGMHAHTHTCTHSWVCT